VRLKRPIITTRIALLLLLASLIVGLELYYPALRAPFVFDDFVSPYSHALGQHERFIAWLSGVRPVLMLTYWLDDRLFGESPLGYHILNLLIHVFNTALVFLVLNRLIEFAGRWKPRTRMAASLVGAALFLVHPLETESVSYVAGRSESLAALFMLLAYAVFLYRPQESISWARSLVVLALFGLAAGSKENAVSLAGVLVLTDAFWPQPFSTRGLRNNWRLYAAMVPGATAAVWEVFRILSTSTSAGFAVRTATWYQYAFTEARAIFVYFRMALVPYGQSIDHDYPVSHTVLDHGALYYLIALGLLLAACIVWRKRYPLACFGLLLALVLLAPTSSVVPIADPLVERRMYLPLMGLILIGCEAASRIRVTPLTAYTAAGALVIVYAVLCYQRNELWSQPSQLWATAALESTGKSRPYANLVNQLVVEHRCAAGIPYLRRAEQVLPNNYDVEIGWSRIYECMGQAADALPHLERAVELRPDTHTYQLLGLLYGEMGKRAEAGEALQKAVTLDPRSVLAHNALALWYAWTHNLDAAMKEYQTSLAINPKNRTAREGIEGLRRAQSFSYK